MKRPVFDLGKMRVQEEHAQAYFKDGQSDDLFFQRPRFDISYEDRLVMLIGSLKESWFYESCQV